MGTQNQASTGFTTERPIRVLIVDDSAIVRKLLTEHLSHYRNIEVVGSAPDPYVARTMIAELTPDVLTLDIEMPRMDGLTFLGHLMKHFPLPVVVVSSLLESQRELAIKALSIGAVDVVPKPGGPYSVGDIAELLAQRITAAAQARLDLIGTSASDRTGTRLPASAGRPANVLSSFKTNTRLIAVGASTGGTSALETLFSGFTPGGFPPVAAVIHMPEGFTKSYAERLDATLPIRVKEAVDGELLSIGTVYIAPGNHQMTVRASGKDLAVRVRKGPKVSGHRPSVDALFRSAAEQAGKNVCGVLLTGMGRDGAEGLLEIRKRGGFTIAQDEATSIVYGMPRAAAELGAASVVLPLTGIAPHIAATWL
jgi:two-component system chemotaxis response regulator CheB